MKLKNIFPLLISLFLLVSAVSPIDSYAKKSRAKATSGQTYSKSKKSKKSKKSRTARGSKKKSGSRSGRSKSRSGVSRSSKSRVSSSRKVAVRTEPILSDSLTLYVNSEVLREIPSDKNPGGLRINSVRPDKNLKSVNVGLNENFTYMPVTQEFISELESTVKNALPDSLADFRVRLAINGRPMSYYINRIDKLPEKYRKNPSFVKPVERDVIPSKGMENDIIALWSSHGRYYRPSSGAWMWQRGVLFETIEDIYTMGYVLPYIVPMLENAGAYVFLPRERDINRNEVIVDNDINPEGEIYSQPYYKETNGKKQWSEGAGEGFIYDLKDFRDTENPFENGTYRQVETITGGTPSMAAWYADIPEDGEYAVYVSYKTLPNSSEDAHYIVNYSGGSKEFTVNQTMGSGTWIYLGTFPLRAGYSDKEPIVILSNLSSSAGRMVTADAVKIGGGMGNIARSRKRSDIYYDPSTPENNVNEDEDDTEPDEDLVAENEGDVDEGDGEPAEVSVATETKPAGSMPVFRTSGYPRYLEGARYWLHWAGFPESVYSPYHGSDDYKDDYTDRGHWVNYLAGGSRVLPDREGLNLPVDLSMALHSDAGKRSDDSFVGTLGIYYTQGGINYKDGTPRMNSRMLTDLLMRQITGDIRQKYEPRWTRRSMWDKSYLEARVAEVPTSLIELMSHQNFADMKYGLDPNFRFDVSRAIYKGMARFLAERKNRELVIQPLPVKDFMIKKLSKNKYRLSWSAVPDPLEPTAMPDRYTIYERTEGVLGFHKVAQTSSTHYDITVTDSKIHSFKIVAVNAGGSSFPSEILALRNYGDSKNQVLIINGFTRLSGPASFSDSSSAGFRSEEDFGVPYIRDISFAGHQTEFRRSAGNSFGHGSNAYETKVIAGNTFDFVEDHGVSISNAGYGFVSASAGAVENLKVNLENYKYIDLILGKQKGTVIGNGKSGVLFRAYPRKLADKLTHYVEKGGHLIISGQYAVSDLYGQYSDDADREFASEVLGLTVCDSDLPRNPRIETTSTFAGVNAEYSYSNTLNDRVYIVERPDCIQPSGERNVTVMMNFSDNGASAATLTKYGKGEIFLMTVPIETLRDRRQKNEVLSGILSTFKD